MQDETPTTKPSARAATLPANFKYENNDVSKTTVYTPITSGLTPHTLEFSEDRATKRKWKQKSNEYLDDVKKECSDDKTGKNRLLTISRIEEFMENALCKKCVEEEDMIDGNKFQKFVAKNCSSKVAKEKGGLVHDYKR